MAKEEEEEVELCEGESKAAADIIFRKAGPDLHLLPNNAPFTTIPVQGLAVSNRFGLTFFSHPAGFSLARTADLVQLTFNLKATQEDSKDTDGDGAEETHSAQGKSFIDVSIPNIRILALSKDDTTLAVCAVKEFFFFNVQSLVNEDTKPVAKEEIAVKDFVWSPADNDAFIMLSKGGILTSGKKPVTELLVAAADWSPDGQNMVYITHDMVLHITSSDSCLVSRFKLPSEMLNKFTEDGSTAYVDTVRWIWKDAVVISCIQVDENGQEIECPVFLLSLEREKNLKVQNKLLLFQDLFSGVDASILPTDSGPYMLIKYLSSWEVAIAACRRSIDDHITIIGWLEEDGKKEAYKLELVNDAFPRIELTASGDDNVLVGLAMDQTTTSIRLPAPWDNNEDARLPPCPLLLCMTLEGRISMFSFVRTDEKWRNIQTVFTPIALPKVKSVTKLTDKICRSFNNIMPNDSINSLGSCRVTTPPELNQPKIIEKATSLPPEIPDKESDVGKGSGKSQISFLSQSKSESSSQIGLLASSSGNKSSFTSSVTTALELNQPKILEKAVSLPPEIPDKESDVGKGSGKSQISFLSQSKSASTSQIGLLASSSVNKSSFTSSATTALELNQPKILEKAASLPPAITDKESDVGKGSGKSQISFLSQSRSASSSQIGLLASSSVNKSSFTSSFSLSPKSSIHSMATASQQTVSSGTMSSSQLGSSLRGEELKKERTPGTPPKSLGMLEKRSQAQASFTSEVEPDFVKELERVRNMSRELDNLMEYINCKGMSAMEQKRTFTKTMVDDIEGKIRKISEACKTFKKTLEIQQQRMSSLYDESMQVDAWRIYVQSLAEQASDSRYRDLWNRQKLNPEMEIKCTNILKADMLLKQEMVELERHLHSLDLNRRGKFHKKHTTNRVSEPQQNLGRLHSVQSLYSTVNNQMVVAEYLSDYLAHQVEKLKNCLPFKDRQLTMWSVKNDKTKKFSASVSSESPDKKLATLSTTYHEEMQTPRRRRESMDMSWVNAKTMKTTVKRPNPLRDVERNHSVMCSKSVTKMSTSLSSSACSTASSSASLFLMPTFTSSTSLPVTSISSVNSMTTSTFAFLSPADSLGAPSAFGSAGPGYTMRSSAATTSVPLALSNMETGRVQNISSLSGSSYGTPGSLAGSSFSSPSSTSFPMTIASENLKTNSKGVNKLILSNVARTSSDAEAARVQKTTNFSGSSCGSSGSTGGFLFSVLSSTSSPVASMASVNSMTNSSYISSSPTFKSSADILGAPSTSVSGGSSCMLTSVLGASNVATFSNIETSSAQNISTSLSGFVCDTGGSSSGSPFAILNSTPLPVASIASTKTMTSSENMNKFLSPSVLSISSNIEPVSGQKISTSLSGSTFGTIGSSAASPLSILSSTSTASISSMKSSSYMPSTFAVNSPAYNLKVPSAFDSAGSSSMVTSPLAAATATYSSFDIETKRVQKESTSLIDYTCRTSGSPTGSSLSILDSTSLPTSSTSANSMADSSYSPSTFSLKSSVDAMGASAPFGSAGSSSMVTSAFGAASVSSTSSNIETAKSYPTFQSSVTDEKVGTLSGAMTAPSLFDSTSDVNPINEEDMEEEAISIGEISFGGFGLGGFAASNTQKTNPFGGSGFTNVSNTLSPSTIPSGQLFRPASFSLPAASSSSQQSNGVFESGFASRGIGNSPGGIGFNSPTVSGFGQQAQPGAAQQALGSALGAFGQTRQLGSGLTAFGSVNPMAGGGFATAPVSGGFAAAATGGGFSGVGGFAGVSSGGGFGSVRGGFASFGGGQTGFGGFSGVSNSSSMSSNLFTQMRK